MIISLLNRVRRQTVLYTQYNCHHYSKVHLFTDTRLFSAPWFVFFHHCYIMQWLSERCLLSTHCYRCSGNIREIDWYNNNKDLSTIVLTCVYFLLIKGHIINVIIYLYLIFCELLRAICGANRFFSWLNNSSKVNTIRIPRTGKVHVKPAVCIKH